ncbi:MAG: hypothetical protein ABI833_04835 [Acidobacteriota bacterium]
MLAVPLFLGINVVEPRDATMMRFLSASVGFGAAVLAMLLAAGLSWNSGCKERRRTGALRQWLRVQ